MIESCSCFPFMANPRGETVYKAITSAAHYFTRSVVINPYDQSDQLVWDCNSSRYQPTWAVTSALGASLICQCNFQYLPDFHKEILGPVGALVCAASSSRFPLVIKGKLYQLTQTALSKKVPGFLPISVRSNLVNDLIEKTAQATATKGNGIDYADAR